MKSKKVRWKCFDCGITGAVAARDVWQATRKTNHLHEKRAGENCPTGKARIFPQNTVKERSKAR